MKILVYDPFFSEIGHYYRYNKYILQMLCKVEYLDQIIYLTHSQLADEYAGISRKIIVEKINEDFDSLQIRSRKASNYLKKYYLYKHYVKPYNNIIDYINKASVDFVFFTSQGWYSFWLAIKRLKKEYIVSAILIKPIYHKYSIKFLLYWSFCNLLRKSKMILVTEDCYKAVLNKHGLFNVEVLPDRYLSNINDKYEKDRNQTKDHKLRLVTVGTISKTKNPISFLKTFLTLKFTEQPVSYLIIGKSLDETGSIITKIISRSSNVLYFDKYQTREAYQKTLTDADFIVIPHEEDYTKYATSGIMWDAFQKKKPILCPNIEPFSYYINRYKIGILYNYDNDNIHSVIRYISKNRTDIVSMSKKNYSILFKDFRFESVYSKFHKTLQKSLNINSNRKYTI